MDTLDAAGEPANALCLTRIEGGHIGFEIQHGRAVKQVNILDDHVSRHGSR